MKKIVLSLVLFFSLERFCYWKTEGFALQKMVLYSSSAPLCPHPIPLFSRPLTFLGAGKQFFAFETADHQFVVKFMKFSRRRPLPWLENLPLPYQLGIWRDQYLAQRAKRFHHLQRSAHLALERLSSECALTMLPSGSQPITLIDKLGIHHCIDLAQTIFFVQKKAVPFPTYFQQNPSEAHALISSYIETVVLQCCRGVCNLDPMVERNYGVANHRLILLDIGSLLAHDKLKTRHGLQREIVVELLSLREWLQKHQPQHLAYFDQQLKQALEVI